MTYFDAHNHIKDSKNSLKCISLEEAKYITKKRNFHFIGLHPWEVSKVSNKEIEKDLAKIEKLLNSDFMIGEIGLDKLKNNFSKQVEIFQRQLTLARKYKKISVIHCVKAYNEIDKIIKNTKSYDFPIIFHNFSSSKQVLENLNRENAYFSFSYKSLKSKKIQEALKACPKEKILLETDAENKKDLKNIKKSYKLASQILLIRKYKLKKFIYNNIKTIFS